MIKNHMTHLYRCTRFQGKEQGDIIEKGKYLGREADVMPLLSISSFDREQPKRLNDYHGEIYKRHFSSPPAPSSPSRARNRAIGGEKTGVNSALGITPKTKDFVTDVAQVEQAWPTAVSSTSFAGASVRACYGTLPPSTSS